MVAARNPHGSKILEYPGVAFEETITPSAVAANTGYADLLLIGTHSTTVIGSYRDDRFQIALQR